MNKEIIQFLKELSVKKQQPGSGFRQTRTASMSCTKDLSTKCREVINRIALFDPRR